MRRGSQFALLLMGLAIIGCGKPPEQRPAAPPAVTVSAPVERQVIQWSDYSGYLSSPDTANVSARVTGLIEEARFDEGALVHKGDVLFIIDPSPFQADLDSKQADVAKAQSQQELAAANVRRLDKVRYTRAISEEDYDTAVANLQQAKAAVRSAQAALETSRLNLQWTRVTAPTSGRISRKYVQAGNLVTGGTSNSTLLTTIVSIDPLYCYVQIPERTALLYQALAARQPQANIASAKIPCFLQLENETNFRHEGIINFIDNQVDPGTGTVQIRGVFSNPSGILAPGVFARLRIPASGRYTALLIPDMAIGTNQSERYVLIVARNDVVEQRPVELGALFGTLRAITSGLRPGEWVIVNGLQKAKPGGKVAPQVAPISTQSLDQLEATGWGSPATQALPQTPSPATTPSSQPQTEGPS